MEGDPKQFRAQGRLFLSVGGVKARILRGRGAGTASSTTSCLWSSCVLTVVAIATSGSTA